MVKIEAIVRKKKFDDVYKVLERSGVTGMTVTDVRGCGFPRNPLQPYVKIEIYADECQVDALVEMFRASAWTGDAGDGKIAVLNIENIYRIRTMEDGAAAI